MSFPRMETMAGDAAGSECSDCEKLLPESGQLTWNDEDWTMSLQPRLRTKWARITATCSLLLSFGLGSVLTYVYMSSRMAQTIAARSPIRLGSDPGGIVTQYNTSDTQPSDFFGRPRPELDAAWAQIEQLNYFTVSAEDIRLTGNGPRGIVYPGNPSSETPKRYLATAEVIYHVHCLNFLRKSSIFKHDYYKDDGVFADPQLDAETRLDHCIDVLRQVLMCKADTTIMPYYWVEGYGRPHPNWNTWHTCTDYDDLLQWTRDRAVGLPKQWGDWRQGSVDILATWPEPGYHILDL